MATLHVLSGVEPKSFELTASNTIGRDPGNSILLTDALVSRRHAVIHRTREGAFQLMDLRSSHGTYVAGKRVSCVLLSHGDELRLGMTRLRFEDSRPRSRGEDTPIDATPGVQKRLQITADPHFPAVGEITDPDVLRRAYEKLRAAYELTRAIGVEHELSAMLERILDTAFQLLPADQAGIFLLEGPRGEPVARPGRTRAGDSVEISPARAAWTEAVSRGSGIIVDGAFAAMPQPKLDPRRTGHFMSEGSRSTMCVPMLYRGEPVGLIQVEAYRPGAFTDDDLEVLSSLAAQAALAVKNVRLRQRMDRVVAEERRRLERVVRDLPTGVLLLDSEHRIVISNSAAEKALAALGEARVGDVLKDLGGVQLEAVLAVNGASVEIATAEPPKRIFVVSAAQSGGDNAPTHDVVVAVQDVTDQREAEGRSARAERMALVGQLAGGVAHDFNNLLCVILNYADLLGGAALTGVTREYVDEIRRAGERAESLTRQLLAFGRRADVRPTVVDWNGVVDGMEKLLRRTLGEHIAFRIARSTPLWSVRADPGRLEQVLLNLAVNARDAMPDGGELVIATENVTLGAAAGGDGSATTDMAGEELAPGRYVAVTVRDTGSGIASHVLPRIFEPFFTTKEVGRGTGLGLATVHSIVRQAGGGIRVETAVGQGTAFKVLLPAVDERPGQSPRAATVQETALGGTETILLAEDDDAVRGLVSRVLEAAGYTVLEARHGAEAAALAQRHPDNIDLLVTDVVMPRMSGHEVVAAVQRDFPGLPVLYITGYADHTSGPSESVLHKPFSAQELLLGVRALLDDVARKTA